MSSTPRPILKRSSSSGATSPPRVVHFPPSPTLISRTFSAHSPTSYDRSPIIVHTNSCAMPERGCPGRTYVPETSSRTNHGRQGRHVHPRACITSSFTEEEEEDHDEDDDHTPTHSVAPPLIPNRTLLPPLIPDLSSESEESDGFLSPERMPFAYLSITSAMRSSQSSTPTQLSFLPHPPSPPKYRPSEDDKNRRKQQKKDCTRKSRPDLERKYGRSSFAEVPNDDGCLGGFWLIV
ncbi:hypothetical protein BD410DRAFT_837733 [Rickenella mellea]|uniref:Uncharacterized protein n=1 Tax=Rickenella mellea TaxID=50990 RepID=A0A4Y7QAX2_9AGAM|nr:hypothetical protein BD410DRAFT_837733 [Rickenella mellea]